MYRTGLCLVAALVLGGCTHATEFVHEKPRHEPVAPVLTRSVWLAIAAAPETDERLENRVVSALRLARTVTVSSERVAVSAVDADYTVELHVRRRASSRGINFLIAWPGFIIFAPAWHGLEWPYRVNTLAIITRRGGGEVARVARSDRYTAYSTSSVYGVGTGLGWFPPLYSVPAFVTGIVAAFVPEESDLHRHFLFLEADEWGRRVATEILAALARDPDPPGPSREERSAADR